MTQALKTNRRKQLVHPHVSNLPATPAIPLPVNRDVCSVCHVSRGALLDEALAPPVDGVWYGAFAAAQYTRCIEAHLERRIAVPSASVPGRSYMVKVQGKTASCNCPAATFHAGTPCRHIKQAVSA